MGKEKKVYVIDCNGDFEFRVEEDKGNYKGIMREALKRGTVYSLDNFQEMVNWSECPLSDSFILIR